MKTCGRVRTLRDAQEYIKQRETLELTLAQKQEELKAITGLNQQILQQGRQYATEIANFRRVLSQP